MKLLQLINSPFKIPKLKWYFGKIAIGTPYFFPRVIDKKTNTFKPKKIGFDFVELGWKTKWDYDDYRFEWAPLASFVFFKWQVAVIVSAPEPSRFWEAWLYYCMNTKGTKRERIEQCKQGFPLDYTVSKWGEQTKVNYYDLILKDKYK